MNQEFKVRGNICKIWKVLDSENFITQNDCVKKFDENMMETMFEVKHFEKTQGLE